MLAPEIRHFIAISQSCYPDQPATSLAEERYRYDRYARLCTPQRPAEITVEDRQLATPVGPLALRLYRQRHRPPQGTVIYLHGGGFVVGNLDSHDAITARLAVDNPINVLSVAYRLAPEHPYPAALDDCRWLLEAVDRGELPTPSTPLLLVGDSAGGTLAALVAQQHPRMLRGLVLIYPMLGFEPRQPAATTEAEAPLLTLAMVRHYRDLYFSSGHASLAAFPLDAPSVDGLPPSLLLAMEHDPLRDDCYAFAERLRAEHIPAEVWLGRGLVHGCLRALVISPGVNTMLARVQAFIRQRLFVD